MLLRHCDWVDQLQPRTSFSKVANAPLRGVGRREGQSGELPHKAQRTKLEQAKTCELESQCGSELRSICSQKRRRKGYRQREREEGKEFGRGRKRQRERVSKLETMQRGLSCSKPGKRKAKGIPRGKRRNRSAFVQSSLNEANTLATIFSRFFINFPSFPRLSVSCCKSAKLYDVP